MTTYFSFLATLQGYAQGKIQPTQSDRFVFNCRRQRVFHSRIPGYVSCMNDLQPHHFNDIELEETALHPDTLTLWQQLKSILSQADRQNRIVFCFDETGRPVHYVNRLFTTIPDAYWFGKPVTSQKFKVSNAILAKFNGLIIR